jgi:hypothetical protein
VQIGADRVKINSFFEGCGMSTCPYGIIKVPSIAPAQHGK